MISNFVLRTKVDALKNEKEVWSKRKKDLQDAFRDMGISKNQAYKINTGRSSIDQGIIINRQRIGKEMTRVEEKLAEINAELRKCYAQEEADRNGSIIEIFNELFTLDQQIAIKEEATRRRAGEPPFKLDFNIQEGIEAKENSKKYKKMALEQLEKAMEFRILLTGLIEKGCEQFGDAEFLKFISPLNRLIIPLAELEKIKKKLF